MKTQAIALLAGLTLLAGCATGPTIYTNSDPAGNIAGLRTYNFAEPLGTDRSDYSSLLSQYLKTAVSRELGARGYVRSDNPELLVNFYTESKEKVQSTTTAGPGLGGFYGWRTGYYGVWGGYETRVTQYTEGTLVIDLIDARRSQLLWEGIAVDRVREASLRDPQNSIDQVVAQIFEQFPWRASAPANCAWSRSMSDVAADLADLRRDFSSRPLRREDLDPDPVRQFDGWFREALAADLIDANAMSVATCDAQGQPSSRMVLLKFYDDAGFVFYTNLESRKAGEIAGNARVALLFFWPELRRQVRIEGEARQVATADTLRYFLRRPRDSQIGAWVSAQSSVISTRAVLEAKFAELKASFGRGEVPLPSFWGGYRVYPAMLEFWQGRENRLHDRFRYRRTADDGWQVERLAP